MGQSSKIWDRAVSCGTDKSHVGNRRLMWNKVQSDMGKNSLMWDIAVSFRTKNNFVGQSIVMWERAVS